MNASPKNQVCGSVVKSLVLEMVFLALNGWSLPGVLKAQDMFFTESFDNPGLLTNTWWSSLPIVTETNGSGWALKVYTPPVTNAVQNSQYVVATLPSNMVQSLAGRSIVIKAQVKAANISTKPSPWKGIKVMLTYITSSGVTNSPYINLSAGTFDWTDFNTVVTLPTNNITSASLKLGLEEVSGTAWFDNVQIIANPVAFEQTFDNPGSLTNGWWVSPAGTPIVTQTHGSGRALMVSNASVGTAYIGTPLSANALKSHRVVLSAHVKGSNISALAHPWNGVKVVLSYTTNGVACLPQIGNLPAGTFDWTSLYKVMVLPDNVSAAQIYLGLENVSGVAWFDDVRVEVDPIIFSESFDNTNAISLSPWSGTPLVTDTNGTGRALMVYNPPVTNAVQNSQYFGVALPTNTVQALAGRNIVINAQVKGSNISALPNPWNGVKVVLRYSMSVSNALYYYQINNLPAGTFDWMDVKEIINVPTNVTSAALYVGLEAVSGTAWIDNISINTIGELYGWVNPTPNYKGHTVPSLRGTMVSTNLQASDVSTLAAWNANVVRWQLGALNYPLGLTTTNYDQVLSNELARLDAVLPVLQQNGMLVVLDLHSLSFHQFDSPTTQAKLISTWAMLANRYKNNTNVWGYDIANEPYSQNLGDRTTLDWNELAEQVALTIRNVDPRKTIIIEPDEGGGTIGMQELRPARTTNVVYSFHWYNPGTYTCQGVYNTNTWAYPGVIDGRTWNSATMLQDLFPVFQFQKKYNASIYVGEFSAVRWAPGAVNWLGDSSAIFETNGWDWSYHAFREWQGWSVEIGEDKNVTTNSPTPTQRELLLKGLFQNNVRPAY